MICKGNRRASVIQVTQNVSEGRVWSDCMNSLEKDIIIALQCIKSKGKDEGWWPGCWPGWSLFVA